MGFTVRILDSQYKFYVESRFHYATNRRMATRIIPFTVGVRFCEMILGPLNRRLVASNGIIKML